MLTEMEFCLLGPLAVRQGGVAVPVQKGKQRAILAALLLSANRVVPLEELTDVVWGAAPPPSARVTVQNYIKRLRHALAGAGPSLISTHPAGYLLGIDDSQLDVTRFLALRASAGRAARARSWDEAAATLRLALALWRGEPLADVPSEALLLREGPRLAELRVQAVEDRVDADLHLGRHAEVIAELQQLARAHPLRERLHAMAMLALYRSGRQGDALAAYQRARRILIDELGAEPGAGLRELHRQVLAADPALASPPSGHLASYGPGPAVPRQLPAAVQPFAGRALELAELTRMLDDAGAASHPMVISSIGGTAGVGKTTLAVQWAHQVTARFTGGQLYVNLRGYDPGQPVPAAAALAGFLRALGVPDQAVPAETDERASLYRSLLAGRRVLVIADNASDIDQVRPLLPGSPGCMVVVTSRDSLAGLVARDGARRLDLDLLPLADAVSLLGALIGARVDDDPHAAAELAAQCSRLPLAGLGAISSRLCRHQEATGYFLEALALHRDAGNKHGEARMLTSLGVVHWHQGDYHGAIGYQRQAQLLYREVQSLSGEAYCWANLGIAEMRIGSNREAADHMQSALALFRQAGDSTGVAMSLSNLGDIALRQGHYQQAEEFLRQAAAMHDAAGNRSGHAHALVPLGDVSLSRGQHEQAFGHYEQALELFRETRERSGEAEARNGLGRACLATGKPEQGRRHHAAALSLAGQIGDKYEQARAHDGLGHCCHAARDSSLARSHWEQALALFTSLGAPEADQIRRALSTSLAIR